MAIGDEGLSPRVRGNPFIGLPQGLVAGLSPRVRGNLSYPHRCMKVDRSIPACAGEPVGVGCLTVYVTVYPRVCGGTHDGWTQSLLGTGLSPRVRGNPAPRCPPGAVCGSIPACAGEPAKAGRLGLVGEVYPRVCGGTPPPGARRARYAGLSPRVRGNRPRPAGWG